MAKRSDSCRVKAKVERLKTSISIVYCLELKSVGSDLDCMGRCCLHEFSGGLLRSSDGCGAPGKSYRCLLCAKYAFLEGRRAIGVSPLNWPPLWDRMSGKQEHDGAGIQRPGYALFPFSFLL